MKFILVMLSDFQEWQRMTPEEAQAFDEGITTFNDTLRRGGAWVSAEGVDELARTVRFDSGKPSAKDGPFSVAREQLAGFWIIQTRDLAAAVEWAKKVPLRSGAIEVRPLVGE